MRRKPGYRWRILAHGDDGRTVDERYTPKDRVCFDEIVVDDWLHVEQMSARHWWMSIAGDVMVNVNVRPDGSRSVLIEYDGALAQGGFDALRLEVPPPRKGGGR